ncbi:MAG TPA: hypothetical protein HA300_09245 [Thermococcaceae archaeon]|nr:hypothetical protein [Thermococcaceae archaeon]
MIEKRKFLLFIFLLLMGTYTHLSEKKTIQKPSVPRSIISHAENFCSKYFPNETFPDKMNEIAGICPKYKDNHTVAVFCWAGCKLVKSGINKYECRGGKIYKLVVDTENWTLLSLTLSNWSEVNKVIEECSMEIDTMSEG